MKPISVFEGDGWIVGSLVLVIGSLIWVIVYYLLSGFYRDMKDIEPHFMRDAIAENKILVGNARGYLFDNCEETNVEEYNCSMDPLEAAQAIVVYLNSRFQNHYKPETGCCSVSSGATPSLGETYIYPDGKILIATTSAHNRFLDKSVECLRTEIATVNNDP